MAANEINVSESVDVKMQADLDKALEKKASLQKEVDAANKKASSCKKQWTRPIKRRKR